MVGGLYFADPFFKTTRQPIFVFFAFFVVEKTML